LRAPLMVSYNPLIGDCRTVEWALAGGSLVQPAAESEVWLYDFGLKATSASFTVMYSA
jgi:hypothetical protein